MRQRGFTTFMRTERGFTLAEVIIALGIAMVVGALLLVIIVNSVGLFYKESSKVGQGILSNDALSKITQNIKNSNAVVSSYTFSQTTYTSSSTQLVLKQPSIGSSGNIISNTFDYFVLFLNQDQLKFKSFPDAQSSKKAQDQVLSLNVQSILIQYLSSANPPQEVSPQSATKVRVTLTLKQKTGANFEQNISTSEANLRNN